MNLRKDQLVEHIKAEWGVGKVLTEASGDITEVFFPDVGKKILKSEFLKLFDGETTSDLLLQKLNDKSDKVFGKYRKIEDLKERFLSLFPGGFHGEKYRNTERNYKVDAHTRMLELLNAETFSQLLEQNQYDEVAKRAINVLNQANLVFPNEKMAFKNALKTESGRKVIAENLYRLLFGEESPEKRFQDFAETLHQLNAAKWTTMTYFLFIHDPEHQMFLKPTVTKEAAEVCAFELNYRTELNWLTYNSLLKFSNYLFKSLSDLEPKDMIDVQSFIWCSSEINEEVTKTPSV